MANKKFGKTYCWLSMDCENEGCPRRMTLKEAIEFYIDGKLAAYEPHGECVFGAPLAAKYGSMAATMEWLRIDKIEAAVEMIVKELEKAGATA